MELLPHLASIAWNIAGIALVLATTWFMTEVMMKVLPLKPDEDRIEGDW
jgi:hypothetical protein